MPILMAPVGLSKGVEARRSALPRRIGSAPVTFSADFAARMTMTMMRAMRRRVTGMATLTKQHSLLTCFVLVTA